VSPDARARLERLLAAARRLADPNDALGREARSSLPRATRLSPEGVELALERCLEVSPSEAELERLCASVTASPRAHVLLSANVFTAAHRALALALAASERVFVRPSRRAPEMAELLARAEPGLFELVDRLAPEPGEPLFAYGSDTTLASLRAELPRGTCLAAHGSGYGIAVIQARSASADFSRIARALSLDLALFDQRGCLSPRLAVIEGEAEDARAFARTLCAAIIERNAITPTGELDEAERAELARQRATFTYAGELWPADPGFVALVPEMPGFLEVCGRSLIVVPCADAIARVRERASEVTTFAAAGDAAFREALASLLSEARAAEFGGMQTPPFDGPVDRRTRWRTL
jgi:hypothetical protein